MDPVTRATVVSLTESGDEVASLLLAVDKTIRSAPRT